MRKNITHNVRLQPPDDRIDFPVSDLYRDHFAAQGLTCSSGRYGRGRLRRNDQNGFTDSNQELDAARQETRGWRSQAIYLESRCAKLEEELQRLQNVTRGRRPNAAGYKGVAVDACA